MGRILRDIYADVSIAPFLGFKGGTCAYFFYELPRFSVDLDFDVIGGDQDTYTLIFERIKTILERYGIIKDSYIKMNTIFCLLSYGDTDHNIKIEISTRRVVPDLKEEYELKEYLGISMFVAKRPYLFASKLAALTLRSETAMRDIYDVWYFAKNNWDIDREVLAKWTTKSLKEYIDDCISLVEQVKDAQILQGLGELLNEKNKAWVKTHLKTETVFLLKNYQSVLR